MSTLKNLADKLATPSADGHHHDHHDHVATTSSSTMMTGTTVQTGEVIAQRQVGTVDVVETVQQVKKVPVVETTRAVETVNTGMAGMNINQHAHLDTTNVVKTELPTTVDHKTVVVDALVEETVRKDRLVEVQPVIHQEVEKEVVHHVVKHINEAPAPSVAGTVTLKPVVQEHVHTHVVEEVHPVIHREIVVQEVERVEQHITEHIVAPTKHIQEVVYEKEVAPLHMHGDACHHAVATERLTNVIVPGSTAAVVGSTATVTTREVLVDQAAPTVTTGVTREVVTDRHTARDLGRAEVHVDKHVDTTHVVGGAHTATVVQTTEVVGEGEKHHHHLHLPSFLGGHKKEEKTHTTHANQAL